MADSTRAQARAVTFDFGQTLAELDHEFLARRLQGWGATFDPVAARASTVSAWSAYGAAKSLGHARAWQVMMLEFLRAGGVQRAGATADDPGYPDEIAKRLWAAQPEQNLWRQPIAGMFELVQELSERGVPLGIISNSEGRLAELVAEMGHAALFPVIADSGRLGIDKPDARIFEHTARALGVPIAEVLHVGDAWEADVRGARAAGAQAIWFAPIDARALPAGVTACRDARELRRELTAFNLL